MKQIFLLSVICRCATCYMISSNYLSQISYDLTPLKTHPQSVLSQRHQNQQSSHPKGRRGQDLLGRRGHQRCHMRMRSRGTSLMNLKECGSRPRARPNGFHNSQGSIPPKTRKNPCIHRGYRDGPVAVCESPCQNS